MNDWTSRVNRVVQHTAHSTHTVLVHVMGCGRSTEKLSAWVTNCSHLGKSANKARASRQQKPCHALTLTRSRLCQARGALADRHVLSFGYLSVFFCVDVNVFWSKEHLKSW